MSLKELIQSILRENLDYQHGQQVVNQAQSLKAVSDDLYTDPIRFIFELIQNADDAYDGHSMKNPLLQLAFVDRQYLIVANYGKGFDEKDVRAVCRVGCGTKRETSEKIGYKGLGFKAVFGQSDYVLIASKGEYFRFEANANDFQWNLKWGKDQQTWERLNSQKFEYPWQICPLWTEMKQIPKPVQTWLFSQTEVVACVIRLKSHINIRDSLNFLISQPHVFMFLKHIRDIRISLEAASETRLNVSPLKDGSIKISSADQKITSHWLLHSCTLTVPPDALKDPQLPEKHRGVKFVEMILAAQIDKDDRIVPVRGTDSVLFAYLPTRISTYNLPIFVNTHFFVNASREHIHLGSSWNQWLFSVIPYETFRWVQALTKNPKWTDKAYDLLPNRIPAKDALASRYNEACEASLQQVPFVLGINKGSLLISQAVVDITMFSSPECLGHEIIRDYLIQTSSTRLSLPNNPFVTNHHRLRNLKIRQFTWEMFSDMVRSPYFLQKFTPERGIRFVQYLFNHHASTQISKRLHEIPFLMDTAGFLRSIHEIYFPSRFNSADWLMDDSTDPYLHPFVMAWLNQQLSIKDWLRKLGVPEKTDLSFVDNVIVPNVDRYINHDNALVTIKRLFNLFCHDLLTTQQMKELCRLHVLTVAGNLVPAYQLYFSSPYGPHLPLDEMALNENLFLSPCYLEEIEDVPVHRMKYFFQCLCVQETISFVCFDDRYPDAMVSAYINAQLPLLPPYAILSCFKNRLSIQFLEWTATNYDFALFYWEHVMRTMNVRQLIEPESLYTQQRRFAVSNLPQWFVRTYACIPTTTGHLLPSGQVFSSNLRSIAGRYLPVFACHTRLPFPDLWENFFGFKTELLIEDYFSLLASVYCQSCTTPLTEEDKAYIQSLYTAMIDRLSRMKPADRVRFQIREPFYVLSTHHDRFVASTDLVISIDANLVLPPEVPQLYLNEINARHGNLKLLLDLFAIRQVTMDLLELKNDLQAQVARSLHRKLRDIQPYLFALADWKKISHHAIDFDLEIFEADQLELFYADTILIHQVPLHLKGNRLYVKKPWNAEEPMVRLPQILCQIFKLTADLEFELRQLLLTPTLRAIHEQFNERNIQVQAHFLPDDPLMHSGTREKFAALIERDNTKLFAHLRETKTMAAAELLLAGLDAQDSPWTGYVYHFTHVENAEKVLAERTLKARAALKKDEFHDSAAEYVIKATRTEAKTYVRFYFRPLTPTQRCNENLGVASSAERYGNKLMCPVPVFFRFNLRSLLAIENLPWKVSLGNMASSHTECGQTRELIEKFDFQHVYADSRTERGKFSSQHEFLIESELDFNQLKDDDITLIFQDENGQTTLTHLIDQVDYQMIIDPAYFFGYNPRVIVETRYEKRSKIVVKIDYGVETEDPGKLLIQIVTKNPTKTITGTLAGIFERDDILTILGKEQIAFVPEVDPIEYAVYYKYAKQIWLVYSNYRNPIFQPSE